MDASLLSREKLSLIPPVFQPLASLQSFLGDFVLWISLLAIFLLIGYEFISTVPRIPLDKRRFGLIATLIGLLAISLLLIYGIMRVFG